MRYIQSWGDGPARPPNIPYFLTLTPKLELMSIYYPNASIDEIFIQAQSLRRDIEALMIQNIIDLDQPKRSILSKTAFTAGRTTGKIKNFFGKTETKAATLVAYWAADAFVASIVLFTTTSLPIFAFTSALLLLHTYATFSVIGEII